MKDEFLQNHPSFKRTSVIAPSEFTALIESFFLQCIYRPFLHGIS